MKNRNMTKQKKSYFYILLGTLLVAFSIKVLYDPIGLVTGGISGIAIIIKEITKNLIPGGVPLWLTNFVLNVPIFLVGWKIKGWEFIKTTLFATVLLSVWLYIIPEFSFLDNDFVLVSIFGGVLTGVGMGFVFMARTTTGGTDMIAALIQRYMRHYSISQIMQVLDGIIVITGAYIFGIKFALYAIVSIYLISKISDGIIEGVKFAKLAYIISDQSDEIAKEIMERLNRGTTGLYGEGMYSNKEKKILFCVVSKKEIVLVKEIVHKIDHTAFVIVNDVREVLGEGFVEYTQ
ncbi:MAG: YitT family protein [Lachnospiraceae bacterium]